MYNNIFFTADEHYGHNNIITFCNRPFVDVNEMRERIIENHNKIVRKSDRIYHIGDMFWRTLYEDAALNIRYRLNGQHFYIYGNHDEVFYRSQAVRESFIWCRDVFNLKLDNPYPNIWLSHYAHKVWNGSHRNSYHLYGHTHAALPEDNSLSCDVGVDAHNFYPVSLEEIHAKMEKKIEIFRNKQWCCVKCGNKFNAVDTTPKLCSKCNNTMELK